MSEGDAGVFLFIARSRWTARIIAGAGSVTLSASQQALPSRNGLFHARRSISWSFAIFPALSASRTGPGATGFDRQPTGNTAAFAIRLWSLVVPATTLGWACYWQRGEQPAADKLQAAFQGWRRPIGGVRREGILAPNGGGVFERRL